MNLRDEHSPSCECYLCQRKRSGELEMELPDVSFAVKGEIPLELEVILPPILPSYLMEIEIDDIFS